MSTHTHAQRQLKKWFLYPIQALLVYAFYGFFKILPLDVASRLGGVFLETLGSRLKANKKVKHNISIAFPDYTEAQKDAIIKAMWNNLGRVMAEYPHLNEMDETRVEIVGKEHLEAMRDSDRAPIFVSGHFYNWEVLPVTGHKNGIDMQLVYRHANNPYVDKLLRRARSPMGKHLARKGVEGARSVHSALKNNQAVGMLIDQKHNRGRAIPFFNRPAMTATAVAELAIRYHAPIVPVFIERLDGAYFRMTVAPMMEAPQGKTDDEAVTEILTTLNGMMEAWIRLHPEGWLWLHRRWD